MQRTWLTLILVTIGFVWGCADVPTITEAPEERPGLWTPMNTNNGPCHFDAASSGIGVDTSTVSFDHTVGTGPNRVLFVAFAIRGSQVTGTSITVQSVTYGGIPLTLELTHGYIAGGTSYVYRLTDPPSGPASVKITLSDPTNLAAVAVSYSHVDPTTPVEATAVAEAPASRSISQSVTSTDTSRCVVDFLFRSGSEDAVPFEGQTERVQAVQNGQTTPNPPEKRDLTASSDKPSSGSTTTMGWSWRKSKRDAYQVLLVLKPAP